MDPSEVPLHFRTTQPLKIGDKVYKSAFDYELSEKDLEKAAQELGETEEKRAKYLRNLKEKLSKEPNFKYRQDDKYWLRFLRVRKYDMKKTYKSVMVFFEQRRKHKNDYGVIPPVPKLKPIQDLNFLTVLPYTDEEGRIIFLMKLNRWNPEVYTFNEIGAAVANVFCIIAMNPRCQINGIVGIFDFRGVTLKHISQLLSRDRICSSISATQSDYPWRMKKVLILGTNQLVRFFYSVIRPMLQRKIAERCFLLGSDNNELHQYINPVLLPKRLGGSLDEEECDVSENVLNNLSYLRWERAFGFQ